MQPHEVAQHHDLLLMHTDPPTMQMLGESEPSGAVVIGNHVRPVEELKTAMLRVSGAGQVADLQ